MSTTRASGGEQVPDGPPRDAEEPGQVNADVPGEVLVAGKRRPRAAQ
jgi:hypothetical protein